MTAPLADAAQALIDSRLDTIERMLLDQIPRADRLAIVREVEAQLYDHLAERNPDDTDRDAVIAALARLDPPEAFLPDESGAVTRPTVSPSLLIPKPSVRSGVASSSARPQGMIAAKVAGILGIVSTALLVLALITILLGIETGAGALEVVFFGLLLLDIPISLLAITFRSLRSIHRGLVDRGTCHGIIALVSLLSYSIYFISTLL